MKAIKAYPTTVEAALARIALEPVGIRSIVVGITASMEGGVAGVRVLVPDNRVEAALTLLGDRVNSCSGRRSGRRVFHKIACMARGTRGHCRTEDRYQCMRCIRGGVVHGGGVSDRRKSTRKKHEPGGSRDAIARVERPLVSVIDDDESVRESLPDLLGEFGFAARAFSSAEEFLMSDCVNQSRCLILDVKMPGMSGPALQRELRRLRREIPIIFITAHAVETVRSRLLEHGAVACLFKPFDDTALREALDAAFGMN